MKQSFLRLCSAAWQVVFCLSAAALVLTPASALPFDQQPEGHAIADSGPGPGGINIGLDFNWGPGGEPQGYTASFIASTTPSGGFLTNCSGGSLTPTTQACDFAIAYSIGGVPQPAVVSGGVYDTWTPPGTAGRICDNNPPNSGPLTLWNCFNSNSFGQIFKASATGTLSNMTMPMTCLNPAGGPIPPGGFFAVLYQVTGSGNTIGATPLVPQVPVDLSTCPTLTSWNGHTFTSGDFAEIPLNFQNATLTAGNFYAVYFAGPDVPGTQLPGFVPPAPAPTLTAWGAIAFAAALLGFGVWELRRRRSVA